MIACDAFIAHALLGHCRTCGCERDKHKRSRVTAEPTKPEPWTCGPSCAVRCKGLRK